MSDEYTSRVPEFDAVSLLQQRLSQKQADANQSTPKEGEFDPYKMMLQKKAVDKGGIAATEPIQTWPEKDVQKLEDFCKEMGIIGFNCGRMSPLAALAMLKKNLGIQELRPNVEHCGPNYPYTELVNKRMLLNG